jgi:hypothetical protein
MLVELNVKGMKPQRLIKTTTNRYYSLRRTLYAENCNHNVNEVICFTNIFFLLAQ